METSNKVERQASGFDDGWYSDAGPPANSWWWSSTGLAVRYTIVIVLFVLIFGFLAAYVHARRRLRKGLQPLSYHRWMVRRQMYYAAQYPYHNRPYYNAHNDAFSGATPGHPAPPPAYNAGQPPPPVYEPAGGYEGSKIAADQNYAAPVHRAGESSNALPLPPAPPAVPPRD